MDSSTGAQSFESNIGDTREMIDAAWAVILPRHGGDDPECIPLNDSDLLEVELAG